MDVNSVLIQLPAPTAAASSDEAALRSQTGKKPSIGGTNKTFASVLRTVQQGESRERPKPSDDADCRKVEESGAETEQGNGVGGDASRSGQVGGSGSDSEMERLSQNQNDQSDDKESQREDGGSLEPNVSSEQGHVLGPVALSQGELITSSLLSTDDPGQSAIDNASLQSSQNNDIAGEATTPVLVASAPGEFVTATTEEPDQAPARSQGETVPMGKQSEPAFATQSMREIRETPSGQPFDSIAEVVVKTVDPGTGEQGGMLTQGHHHEEQAASAQPTTEGGKQAAYVSQELSRLGAVGPHLDGVVERSVGQKQVEGVVQLHAEPRPQSFPHDGDERPEKPVAMAPDNSQAFPGSGQPSDMLWSNQDDRQPGSHETPWPPHPVLAPSHAEFSDNHLAQAMTAGNPASPQPQPVDSRPALPVGAASSVAPAPDVAPFVPTMSRSVVFQIAEPDLGHINIRVAMTNELVHAHLSSDRSEVGQFLFNGQDRLQSALQSNGLEMGQFRVDIDRQSGGRSFQQGQPHDQNRMWQQVSNGAPRDYGLSEPHDHPGLRYAGRLNVVA